MAFSRRRTWKLTSLLILGLATSSLVVACGGTSESKGSSGSGTGGDGSGGTNSDGGTSSGGSTAGPAALDTGLDEDAIAGDLSEDELDQLCSATQEYVEGQLPSEKLCALAGSLATLLDPENTEACEVATAECLAENEGGLMGECNLPTECEITVGEYEACVNDQFAALAPLLLLAPDDCESSNPELLLAAALLLPEKPPASCQVVEEKCPGALEDPMGTGGTGSGGAPSSGGSGGSLGGMAGSN